MMIIMIMNNDDDNAISSINLRGAHRLANGVG